MSRKEFTEMVDMGENIHAREAMSEKDYYKMIDDYVKNQMELNKEKEEN